jgi:hypothetical protein
MQIGGAALVRPWHSTLESLQALGRNQDASLGHYYYLLPALNDPRHSVCQLPSIPIAPSHSPATTRLTCSLRIPTRPACNVFDLNRCFRLWSSRDSHSFVSLFPPPAAFGHHPRRSRPPCDAPPNIALSTPTLHPYNHGRVCVRLLFPFYFSPVVRTHPD